MTEKQQGMISKIEGIRRKLTKFMEKKSKLKKQEEVEFDENAILGKVRGLDKQMVELKQTLEAEEKKLRTSLKSSKSKDQNKKVKVKKRKLSEDEDDFYDRTKVNQFYKNIKVQNNNEQEEETYDSIKTKLESLYKQRASVAQQM